MIRSTLVLPALLWAVLLTGCTYAPGTPDPDTLPGTTYPQVVTLYGLDGKFLIDQPRVVPETDRPMSVSVPIRSKPKFRDIPCQYRFIFLDANGTPLDPDPAWKYVFIHPRARVYLTGNAPDTGAVDWLCEVRPDRVERLR